MLLGRAAFLRPRTLSSGQATLGTHRRTMSTSSPALNPKTHRAHTESTTTIHLSLDDTAFLNPVQQFNRDLSISCIRAWGDLRREEAQVKFDRKQKNREEREKKTIGLKVVEDTVMESDMIEPVAGPSKERTLRIPKFTILEALAATGLRSIRYAKEIPDVRCVLANDLSASACQAMEMNIALNGVGADVPVEIAGTEEDIVEMSIDRQAGPTVEESTTSPVVKDEESALNDPGETSKAASSGRRERCNGKVRVNQGDACDFMYSRRDPKKRVEVVDLDPYGTAAPFIDAAIGCIADGGLLAVTCTDSAVFAGSQYPEKAFANYGGASVNAEFSHEVGLRLVLNSIASCAARYGRYIEPLVCFSVDFYLRLFIRVHTGAKQVKEAASNIGIIYICGFCQSNTLQPFGRTQSRETKGGEQKTYKTAQVTVHSSICVECGHVLHVGGPMWLGPIHDPEFAKRALRCIEGKEEDYGTFKRMHGMLTLASEELPDPFYFTMNRICGFFKSPSGPTSQALSAILNAGYDISRSHASPGSIKTNAPRSFIFDIVREIIKEKPVRMDKIPEGSPARQLLAKEMTHKIDFTPHEGVKAFDKGGGSAKGVMYQMNPLPNWGPATKARITSAVRGKAGGQGQGQGQGHNVAEVTEKRVGEGLEKDEGKKPKVAEDMTGEEEVLNS